MKGIGIDLGTTNSCVCVLDEAGLRVLRDGQGNPTVPSVVWQGRDGGVVVGLAARNRIGSQPSPIATIKRKMGSSETVNLGGEAKSPVEVSALILAHLKAMAEERLGEPVERAVVTVPAYFSHVQRQQTDEAAKLAGFREVRTLLEPVAAALAYSLGSEQEALRVFVYDLGGGTFDATVLEKDPQGGLTVLAFGGDPYLGGDDVDARFAQVLLRRLGEQGYRLDLNLEDPADGTRFQLLKFWAEHAKQELSRLEVVTLSRQGLMEDQAGATVDLDLTLTRCELEEVAEDLIERSLAACLATLARAEVAADAIDAVLMVGGMSRMPMVARKLAALFPGEPKNVDPDLIVAQGAALKAAELFGEETRSASGLRLSLRYEPRSALERVRIAGTFDRVLEGHTVYLLAGEREHSQRLDGSDRFRFEAVALLPERENRFSLSVEDEKESLVLEREIVIVHAPDTRRMLSSPGSVVTRPIAVRTVDGRHALFSENTTLPHTASHLFETTDQSGRIVAPIFEGDHEVARLAIENLPPDLRPGTLVRVEVRLAADYTIEAVATVPELDREVAIRFAIEPVDVSEVTPAFVRERLGKLEQKAHEAVAAARSHQAVEKLKLRFALLRDEIEIEIAEVEPKRMKLVEKLGELALLVDSLAPPPGGAELKPTFEELNQRLAEIVERAVDGEHPRLAEARPQIEQLRSRARDGWERKDAAGWKRVNEQLAALARLLAPEISPRDRALGMAAWLLAEEIPQLRTRAAGRFASELAGLEEEAYGFFLHLQLGAVQPAEVIQRLLALFQARVEPLRQQLGLAPGGELGVRDPGVLAGHLRARS